MKPLLWLLVAPRAHAEVTAVAPTLAWVAEDRGATLEVYLEDRRDGRLFARSGSTVLSGGHFQQFNYLCAAFDVRFILLGDCTLFLSSISVFHGEVLAQGDNAAELYAALGIDVRREPVEVPLLPPAEGRPDLRPYFYQEVYFRRGVGIAVGACPDEDYRSFTVRMAERWVHRARGVAFGDPDIVLAMMATFCREKRVAVFGERRRLPPNEVVANAYAEECSTAAGDAARLAAATGNRLLVGRQTGDGDLFAWSSSGVAIQIADPNRPPFPVVAQLAHPWRNRDRTVFEQEPDDATLARWADEGKRVGSLLVHSGEMAHNEAMVNLVDLCITTGLKLGIGVHAARYETCPQLWEALSVPLERGGALGLVEPILHSGGMGVLAESVCPPEQLADHCRSALRRIADIAGPAWKPRGYLAFMDSDMPTFTRTTPDIYEAIAANGLEYTVSCALPGRNRILYATGEHIVLNQSSRSICVGSPYVRVCAADDLGEKSPGPSPGWWLGVIDAPVVAFSPYIWRAGSRFMEIVRALTSGHWVNTTPRVVARYARLLRRRGLIGVDAARDEPQTTNPSRSQP